jgi:hypothetical protein
MESCFLGQASVKLLYRNKTVGAIETRLLVQNPGPLEETPGSPFWGVVKSVSCREEGREGKGGGGEGEEIDRDNVADNKE